MKPLSKKEVEIISQLEFNKQYFFTRQNIKEYFKTPQQLSDFIYGLRRKGRIIKINQRKYYLIPIKAKSGSWSEDPFIIADEVCNGQNYVIGGWAAANYWKLTEQMPLQIDIYTTRRQGKTKIMNTRFVFHRTTKQKISKAITKQIINHQFKILKKEEAQKWLSSKA